MVYSIILNAVLLIIIITILVNNARRKEIKYRILITKIDQSFWYRPQVRIKGIWFNVCSSICLTEDEPTEEIYPSHNDQEEFVNVQDALELISDLKRRGNFKLHSDQNLLSNQTIEYVE